LYFYNKDDERCGAIQYIYDRMKEDNLKTKEVYKAKMITNVGYFYCRKFFEVGEVGETCGKFCASYKPRNGKNGRCTYSSNCYELGAKMTIKIKE
ncbi:MAG: hypothetical protein GY756_27085, partial [bacterium]|nr:hypothetical protein [bacterium]